LGYLTGKYIAETLIKQAEAQQAQVDPEVELTKVAEQEAARLYQRADILTTYLANWLPEYIKQANEGLPPEAAAMAAGGPEAAGGMPPGADPSAGGMPPGGDPSAGGPPGGDPSAGGADGGLPPELIQLAEALLAQGVTPEQLEQLLAQAGAQGGAGGGDPSAGGPPPGADPSAGGLPPDAGAGAPPAPDAGAVKAASLKHKQDLVKTANAVKAALAKARTVRK
jgi:hypothetical protein